jgi:hypothetical protein
VGVSLQGYPHLGMAQPLLDNARVCPGQEQHGRVGVS